MGRPAGEGNRTSCFSEGAVARVPNSKRMHHRAPGKELDRDQETSPTLECSFQMYLSVCHLLSAAKYTNLAIAIRAQFVDELILPGRGVEPHSQQTNSKQKGPWF